MEHPDLILAICFSVCKYIVSFFNWWVGAIIYIDDGSDIRCRVMDYFTITLKSLIL